MNKKALPAKRGPGGGRKKKYSEKTTLITFRVPKSQESHLRELVEEWLKQFEIQIKK